MEKYNQRNGSMVEWRGGLPFLALGVGRILMRDKGSKMEHYEVFRKSVVNPPAPWGARAGSDFTRLCTSASLIGTSFLKSGKATENFRTSQDEDKSIVETINLVLVYTVGTQTCVVWVDSGKMP